MPTIVDGKEVRRTSKLRLTSSSIAGVVRSIGWTNPDCRCRRADLGIRCTAVVVDILPDTHLRNHLVEPWNREWRFQAAKEIHLGSPDSQHLRWATPGSAVETDRKAVLAEWGHLDRVVNTEAEAVVDKPDGRFELHTAAADSEAVAVATAAAVAVANYLDCLELEVWLTGMGRHGSDLGLVPNEGRQRQTVPNPRWRHVVPSCLDGPWPPFAVLLLGLD